MTLRAKITCLAVTLRIVGAAMLFLLLAPWCSLMIAAAVAAIWMIWCGPVLRELLLPPVFPSTRCPGCRRDVPLVGRWKCGDHYIDHRERHILAFLCCHGHRLEGFDCPRCRATILVQRGDPKEVRHGSAIRLRTTSRLTESAGLLIGHDEKRREVRLPDDRLAWHVAITGGTGRGKSTLLANLALQFIRRGDGFTILDPGGDLARAVLQQIPSEREGDVLYLDVSDRQHPFSMNILCAKTDVERAVLTEELLGVFERLHSSSWGPLLAHQLRMALRAVMAAGGTLRDVYGMFMNARTRTRIVDILQEPDLQAFWTEEFPSIPAMRRSAVTNKLAPLVSHPVLGPIICSRDCILDADAAIEERKIVLVNLASGSPSQEVTTLLGTFLVHKLIAAAYRQGNRPADARERHVLITDEFQRFMHRAAGFDQILAEARKYKLSLIVANQFVEQLVPAVRAALFGNVGCLATFRVGHRDARVLEPEFTGCEREELTELGLGECIVRIGTDWSRIRTPPPPIGPESDPSNRIISQMLHAGQQRRELDPGQRNPSAEANDAEGEDVEFVQ